MSEYKCPKCGLHLKSKVVNFSGICSICGSDMEEIYNKYKLKEEAKKVMDKYEKAIMDLCYKLTQEIYSPIRKFIRSINTEGKTYDFGYRIECFKFEIEKAINNLKEVENK